jgi:hypothetical protein
MEEKSKVLCRYDIGDDPTNLYYAFRIIALETA